MFLLSPLPSWNSDTCSILMTGWVRWYRMPYVFRNTKTALTDNGAVWLIDNCLSFGLQCNNRWRVLANDAGLETPLIANCYMPNKATHFYNWSVIWISFGSVDCFGNSRWGKGIFIISLKNPSPGVSFSKALIHHLLQQSCSVAFNRKPLEPQSSWEWIYATQWLRNRLLHVWRENVTGWINI